MKPLRALALTIATTLLVLTFLLVRGTTPDANLHERMLEALRSLTLNSATLQRDVMRARAGLLRNYDPIVRSVENLHDSAGRCGPLSRLQMAKSVSLSDERSRR